jgi:hypothetical protein
MPEIYPKLLLVEGNNDVFVCLSLLKHHKLVTEAVLEEIDRKVTPLTYNGNKFGIKNKDGVTNILNTLDVEVDATGLVTLGIIVDADDKLSKRWKELTTALTLAGYTQVPANPDPTGTIIQESGKPTIGIWIMPDNHRTGILEDFASDLIPLKDTDPLWSLSKDCLAEAAKISPKIAGSIKAHIYTWLAWQKDPGTPLGWAITKHYLDANAVPAQHLIDWMRRLFA